MELDGLDALIAKFEQMENDIDDDVETIVKNNTIEMTGQAVKNGQQRFDKGYATGFTVRNIETQRVSGLSYKTISKSGHSGFLEFGTRYMDATWFLRDSFTAQKKKFLDDIENLVK